MQAKRATTFFFIPPVRKPAGGVAVIYRMAAFLHEAGHEVRLALREKAVWRPDAPGLPEVDAAASGVGPGDVWVVPEGWVNGLAPGLAAGARCFSYVQNWAYLFTGLPPGVDWRSLPVELLAVSRPVAWFMREALGVDAPILRPGIDLELFRAPAAKPAKLTVAWMPRKNKALAEQVRAVVQARGHKDLEWLEIGGMDQAGVAAALGRSHVFLASGFPEGCPLPPLEAMACGAIPVGFAGLGGWDYMRHAGEGGCPPPCPLDDMPWGGNGFFAYDNDVMGAALGLEKALNLWRAAGPELAAVLGNCARAASAYGLGPQRQAVLDFWAGLR
ncbi:MAG: glycosyltransferase family 1 protein [Acidobacteriota bacterium]